MCEGAVWWVMRLALAVALVANVVFCYANTTEVSDNGCLVIVIRQLLMFIKLHLCAGA